MIAFVLGALSMIGSIPCFMNDLNIWGGVLLGIGFLIWIIGAAAAGALGEGMGDMLEGLADIGDIAGGFGD